MKLCLGYLSLSNSNFINFISQFFDRYDKDCKLNDPVDADCLCKRYDACY